MVLARQPRMRFAWLVAISARIAYADEPGTQPTTTELAKTSQNPISDLVSVPLQFNFNNGGAVGELSIFNLTVQPVVPIHLTASWNLIARTIIPFTSIPVNADRESGLGDIQEQLFFTPVKDSGFIWGAGPMLSFPTATLAPAVTGSWAAGPAAVALWVGGPWVVGTLATTAFTYGHSGNMPSIGSALVQPFINFNVGAGWTFLTTPMFTASWGESVPTQWTVPLGAGVSWTTHIRKQALQVGLQYYYNVVHPDPGTPNQVQFVVSFLFPTETEGSR